MDTELGRAHVLIGGTVQNVNFRAATRDEARRHGVLGWVKNLPDGRVEAVFEGSRAAVQRMVAWCYSGPSHATVDTVEVTWEAATHSEGPFGIAW
ncbi:MAG: acylphosphatase [Herpetosiphon sp.]